MRVEKRPAFFHDLHHYATHIALYNPDAAFRFLAAAEDACMLLSSEPHLGHQEKFRKLVGIRSWRVPGFGDYLIFYCIKVDAVEILRLIHGARDLPRFFRPL
jgi:toxin ParE1/3/4